MLLIGFGEHMATRAVGNNIDLQVMAARADAAAAEIGQARATLLPIFNVGARTDTVNITGDFDLGTSNKYGVGGDMTWEIDTWGKARKGVLAKKSAYAASAADYRAAYLSIVSSVAQTYFMIREADAQLHAQGEALERNRQLLGIYEDMHQQGLIPEHEVSRQRAEVASVEIALNDLARGRRLGENSLATLIGTPAGEFSVPDTQVFAEIVPVRVPAGLPSELLSRRPDIVAAEFRLRQSVALEGQARLAQLPITGLTGLGGSASFGLSNLLNTWTMGLSSVLKFPVFDPNVRARIPVAEAQVTVAEQQYRATVMRAFEEVENALVELDSRRAQQTLLNQRLAELSNVAAQQREKLNLGLVSQLDVLEGERALLSAQQQVYANRWRVLAETVSLFKAVGGGWPPSTSS